MAGALQLRLTKVPEQDAPRIPIGGTVGIRARRTAPTSAPRNLASLPRPYADAIVTNSGFICLSAGWTGNRVIARDGVDSLTRILS